MASNDILCEKGNFKKCLESQVNNIFQERQNLREKSFGGNLKMFTENANFCTIKY
jgi:hypothetical protein